MNSNRLWILLGLLMAMVLFAACTPVPKPPTGPPPPGARSAWFVIEASDVDGLPVSRRVGLTFTAFQADGRVAPRLDPSTGAEIPNVPLETHNTPWSYKIILDPGVVGVSMKVDFFGIYAGDVVTCHVEEDGHELPGTRNTSPMIAPGGSYVTVSCVYQPLQ